MSSTLSIHITSKHPSYMSSEDADGNIEPGSNEHVRQVFVQSVQQRDEQATPILPMQQERNYSRFITPSLVCLFSLVYLGASAALPSVLDVTCIPNQDNNNSCQNLELAGMALGSSITTLLFSLGFLGCALRSN